MQFSFKQQQPFPHLSQLDFLREVNFNKNAWACNLGDGSGSFYNMEKGFELPQR